MVQPRDRVVLAVGFLVVAVLLAGLAFAGSAGAQNVQKTQDASGNGHDLTEVNGPENATSDMMKFPIGYAFSNTSYLEAESDPVFVSDSDMSLTLAANRSAEEGHIYFASSDTETAGEPWEPPENGWAIGESPNFEDNVAFLMFEGGVLVEECGVPYIVTPGEPFSLWLTYETFTIGPDLLDIQMREPDGPPIGNDCNFSTSPDVGNVPLIGATGSSEVFEVRFWDELVDQEVLATIAEPSEPEFTLALQGDEEAAWFLQFVILPGEADPVNRVNMWVKPGEDGERVVLAEAVNSSFVPLVPGEGMALAVTRTDGQFVEYWNFTTDQWQLTPHREDMVPVTNTLFNKTFPGHFEGVSTVRLTASAAFQEAPQNTEDIALGTLDLDMSHDWLQEATIGALTLGDATWLLLWFAAFIFAARLQWLFAAGIAMFGALGGVVENPVVSPENPLLVIVLFFGATLLHIMHDWRASKGSTGAA